MIEAIAHLHQQILHHVASGDATISGEQQRLLPVIVDNFGSASRRWLNGMCSAAEARFQIRVGCHLLDLSDAQVAAEFERGALVGDLAGTGRG